MYFVCVFVFRPVLFEYNNRCYIKKCCDCQVITMSLKTAIKCLRVHVCSDLFCLKT